MVQEVRVQQNFNFGIFPNRQANQSKQQKKNSVDLKSKLVEIRRLDNQTLKEMNKLKYRLINRRIDGLKIEKKDGSRQLNLIQVTIQIDSEKMMNKLNKIQFLFQLIFMSLENIQLHSEDKLENLDTLQIIYRINKFCIKDNIQKDYYFQSHVSREIRIFQ